MDPYIGCITLYYLRARMFGCEPFDLSFGIQEDSFEESVILLMNYNCNIVSSLILQCYVRPVNRILL